MKKAEKIVEEGKIQQLDDTTWNVAGTNEGEIYEVSLADKEYQNQYDLVCKKVSTKINSIETKNVEQKSDLCIGWKFHRDCKHCQAVRLFRKDNQK